MNDALCVTHIDARRVMAVNRKVRHVCVMAREDPHFRLRLPAELKAQVEAAAKAANRSINAEIVARLEMPDVDATRLEERISLQNELIANLREQIELIMQAVTTMRATTHVVSSMFFTLILAVKKSAKFVPEDLVALADVYETTARGAASLEISDDVERKIAEHTSKRSPEETASWKALIDAAFGTPTPTPTSKPRKKDAPP